MQKSIVINEESKIFNKQGFVLKFLVIIEKKRMTDNQKDTKTKKLTLGGARLSLGNYSKKVITPVGSSGSVVVEVKRGKAAGNSLTLSNSSNTAVDSEQNERRLEALSRSKSEIDKTSQLQIGSLSKLAEINNDKREQEEADSKKVDDIKSDVFVEKTSDSNKREQKKNQC